MYFFYVFFYFLELKFCMRVPLIVSFLQDGCNLVCRTGLGSRRPREYKGIGDEQLGDTDQSPDDGLLPM